MTREELHALVWSQPMRTIAKTMGISDVALAKRCKTELVPVPPRGWWAKKEAGKAVRVEPLPPLPFALADYFPAFDVDWRARNAGRSRDALDADPEQPLFRDFGTVSEDIRAVVKDFKVPAELADPHPIVARLLKQDAERAARWKPKARVSQYLPDRHAPWFSSDLQVRRLRILSALFRELERLGCKVVGSTHAGERFALHIGGHYAHILFGLEGGRWNSTFDDREARQMREIPQRLRFDLEGGGRGEKPIHTWRDGKIALERQAPEIVRAILIDAEDKARSSALYHHKWQVEERRRSALEAERRAKEAEQARIQAEANAREERRKDLLSGANALEEANRIRRYVEAVSAAKARQTDPVSSAELTAWSSWALNVADELDPIVSGRFLDGLAGDDGAE